MADPAKVKQGSGRFKILPIGKGKHERDMIETLVRSGYDGPIGIIGHRADVDVEQVLRENLRGLSQIVRADSESTHE
jgi:hypothetical protein